MRSSVVRRKQTKRSRGARKRFSACAEWNCRSARVSTRFRFADLKKGVSTFSLRSVDEEKESRVLQPYRKPRLDAEIRAQISRRVPVFRKGTNAHGSRRRRGLHEHYSPRLSS